MQTLTIKARSDENGVIRLEIPTQIVNKDLEIVLVMQPAEHEPVDDMGYPIGYFEETYGMFADEPLQREQPANPDIREELE